MDLLISLAMFLALMAGVGVLVVVARRAEARRASEREDWATARGWRPIRQPDGFPNVSYPPLDRGELRCYAEGTFDGVAIVVGEHSSLRQTSGGTSMLRHPFVATRVPNWPDRVVITNQDARHWLPDEAQREVLSWGGRRILVITQGWLIVASAFSVRQTSGLDRALDTGMARLGARPTSDGRSYDDFGAFIDDMARGSSRLLRTLPERWWTDHGQAKPTITDSGPGLS